MSEIDENHLHADPGIESHHPDHATAIAAGGGHGVAESPLQRERARTIFQKGAPGRRAFACPPLEVAEVDAEQLLPARFRRAEPARLPEPVRPLASPRTLVPPRQPHPPRPE